MKEFTLEVRGGWACLSYCIFEASFRRVISENTVECSASAGFRKSSESGSVESGTIEDCLFRFEHVCP